MVFIFVGFVEVSTRESNALTCLKNCGSNDLSAHQIDKLHIVGKKPKIRLKPKPQASTYRCKY